MVVSMARSGMIAVSAIVAASLALVDVASAGSPVPVLMWSESEAFAGRNEYVDARAGPANIETLVSGLAAGKSPYLVGEEMPRRVVALVADDLSRAELARHSKTQLKWLQSYIHDSASSMIIPSFVMRKVARPDLVDTVELDGANFDVSKFTEALSSSTQKGRVVLVRVPSITSASTAALVQEISQKARLAVGDNVIYVVTGKMASVAPTTLPDVFTVEHEAQSILAAPRKLLSVNSGNSTGSSGVHSTPAIMAGTVAGLALTFVLALTVSCLASIDSSPRMFRQPPGPKGGDPQYNGTPREGTRFYPYRNLPNPEY